MRSFARALDALGSSSESHHDLVHLGGLPALGLVLALLAGLTGLLAWLFS